MEDMAVKGGVAYDSDKDLVKKAASVWLVNFGDSSLDFELVVWLRPEAVKRPGAVNADYLWAIETALGKYGIEIPFPQRDLHVRSIFGKADSEGLGALSRPPSATE